MAGDAAQWNQVGVERRIQGDLRGALAAFDSAIALVPERSELHANRASILSALGRHDEAVEAFRHAVDLDPGLPEAWVGLAQTALLGMKIDQAVAAFENALMIEPESIPAHLGLYEALQVRGDRARAVEHQGRALAQQRLFQEKAPAGDAPTMLMLCAAGDWQANIPLEYLYAMMPFGVWKLFVDPGLPLPAQLPRADLVFNAVAQSSEADPVLARLERVIPRLGLPSLNDPARVRLLSRDRVARDYAGLEDALVPATRLVARDAVVFERAPLAIRPLDSQAGKELVRIEQAGELAAYLATTQAAEFFVAPFIDYKSADGFYRKYRVIFVEGKPFPHHLAISDRWMVHYYNARNADEEWIRDEEERFLADIGAAFDGPRASVLNDIAERAGLDYFGMDCSILPDGRVLIFEIDVAMLVHLGDPVEKYPYKHRYVPRIYEAVEHMIRTRAQRR